MRNKRFYFICAITVLFIALIAPNPLSAQSGKNYREYYGELPTDGQKFTHGLLVLKVTEPAKVDTDDTSLYSCGKVQLVGCNSSDADIEICDTIMTYEKSLDRFLPFEIGGVYSGSDIEVDSESLKRITSMKLGCAGGLSSLRTSGSARGLSGLKSVSFAPQFNSSPTLPLFNDCNQLESIDIPECITRIPENCFRNCSALESINVHEGLYYIGDYAFYGCSSLKSIDIPKEVYYIGNYAFYGCSSLKSIDIPERIIHITEACFRNCSALESINIPKQISYIRDNAFNGCKRLQSIELSDNLKEIGRAAFANSGLTHITTIPQGVNIGIAAFAHSNLKQITVSKGVNIGEEAFYYCSNLNQVTLSQGVNIGKKAFCFCNNLKQVTIPQGANVGNQAFAESKINQVTVLEGATIGYRAFYRCYCLNLVTISQGVKIGNQAFANCIRLYHIEWEDELTIGDSKVTIGDSAFYKTKLVSLTLPEYVTDMGEYAFADCESLTKVSLSKSLKIIRPHTFQNCIKLSSVNIPPYSVTEIQEYAFYSSGLTKLDLPDSVKKLGRLAFYRCNELTDISFNLDTIGSGAFEYCPKIKHVHSKSEKAPYGYHVSKENGKVVIKYPYSIFDHDVIRHTGTLYVPQRYYRDPDVTERGMPFPWDFTNIVICPSSTLVDDITSDSDTEVSFAADGCSLSGAEGMPVSVYTTDGRTVYATPAYDGSQLPLKRGAMYIIAAGQQRLKVAR